MFDIILLVEAMKNKKLPKNKENQNNDIIIKVRIH